MSQQQIAIVTGGSRGVGLFLSRELSNVMPVLSLSRGAIPSSKGRSGYPIDHLAVDLADIAELERHVGEWLDRNPNCRVAHLVLNGASSSIGLLQNALPRELETAFRINVFSAVVLVGLISKRRVFCEEGSQVTYLTSSLARMEPALTFAGIGLYSATKAAISRLAMVQAREFALTYPQVRVARVHPGVVDTDMQAELRSNAVVDPLFAVKTEGLPPYKPGDWETIEPIRAMRTINAEMAADFVLWACGRGDHSAREFDYYASPEYHAERDGRLAARGFPHEAGKARGVLA